MSKEFLKVQNGKIVKGNKPVFLKGVNLGGWLMMEGYILHAPNRAEQLFKKDFESALGAKSLCEFEEKFRDNFIQEKDFQLIASLGFNCIRLPFNYRLIEKSPYKYDKAGLSYLDRALSWAKKYKLWIILDLHAACGSQNFDWHSDSLGEALLWTNKEYQQRTFSLWEFLAERYQNETQIAGYDLLNESVTSDVHTLNVFYQTLIHRIRQIDKNHIFFIEGNNWATDLKCLDRFLDDNYVLSLHFYSPNDFSFNFVPHLKYPIKNNGTVFNRKTFKEILLPSIRIAKEHNAPIFVGEFGVNYRQGVYGEDIWVHDVLNSFEEFGFHWTYWTYKAIKNSIFPDGILSYMNNPPWVNRHGPATGWETFKGHWPSLKKEMMESWDTKNFTRNTKIIKALI